MKDSINSHEFQGMARSARGKGKTEAPTVKVPKMSKAAKQRLVPYQNPQRRTGLAGV